jgi:hypothetical protein
MAKMNRFNTKAMKLSTAGVREMYARLKAGEINQGEASRIYGLGVIQVGRIARGESRAQETGANGDEVQNNELRITEQEFDQGQARLFAKLNPGTIQPAAEPPHDAPPTLQQQKVSDELDKLEKGD